MNKAESAKSKTIVKIILLMALILFYSSTPYAETTAPLDKKGQNSAESILDIDTPWNQALT